MIDLVNGRAFAFNPATPDERLDVVERIVLDLMMEIEALRAAVIELSAATGPLRGSEEARDEEPAGVAGPHHAYGKAYLETAWLSHWAAGHTSGQDKIVACFYCDERHDDRHEFRLWRELSMLKRLGYDAAQLRQYVESAQAAETCT
jgi:hypothetical protein